MELIVGECSGKMRSMPTPKLTRRTVKVAPEARPFFEITTPSNACRRSFSFSPSPSFKRTLTRTVSPGRNSGRSLRSCASCSFAITRFMFVFPADPLGRGQHTKAIFNYREIGAIFLAEINQRQPDRLIKRPIAAYSLRPDGVPAPCPRPRRQEPLMHGQANIARAPV